MARRKQDRSASGDPIVGFLASLENTGATGFEGLVRELLSAETGQRFRLAKAGNQAGKDGASEPRYGANSIKFEAKRYLSSQLDSRMLQGEIVQAYEKSPFDIWVLVATCEVGAVLAEEIEKQVSAYGCECLFIDRPEQGLSRLDVLLAAHPDVVKRFVAPDTGETEALQAALHSVRRQAGFEKAMDELRLKLRGTLLGYASAERRVRADLAATLTDSGSAEAEFNQKIAIRAPDARLVRRVAINDALDRWWGGPAGPRRVALLGEGGMGKSWAMMAWIDAGVQAGTLPLTLVFSASMNPEPNSSTIVDCLPGMLRRRTGVGNAAHWESRIKRWLDDEAGPSLLIVIDGLNERPDVDWRRFFGPLLHERLRARIALLVTDRPGHWRPSGLEHDDFQTVEVGGYTGPELRTALKGRNIAIEDIPNDLQALISTPLYCDLVAEHFHEMVEHKDFTRERLILFDVMHRRQRNRGFPLDQDEFFDAIRKLAKRHRANPEFRRDDILEMFPELGHRPRVYQEIIDGGLLVPKKTRGAPTYVVEHTRLLFGLGMLLADDAEVAARQSTVDLREVIESWLEPHAEMDLKVEILATAVFHCLLDESYPNSARRELLRQWLFSRNRNAAASDEGRFGLVLRASADWVTIAEEFWSSPREHGAARSFLTYAFVQYRDDARLQPHLAQGVKRWMSFILSKKPSDIQIPDDIYTPDDIQPSVGMRLPSLPTLRVKRPTNFFFSKKPSGTTGILDDLRLVPSFTARRSTSFVSSIKSSYSGASGPAWAGLVFPELSSRTDALRAERREIKAKLNSPKPPKAVAIEGHELVVIGDDRLCRLKELGFLIMSAGSRRPFADGLVAWALACAVEGGNIYLGSAQWVIRLSADDLDPLLLESAKLLLESGNPVAKRAAHLLLGAMGSRVATQLSKAHPEGDDAEKLHLGWVGVGLARSMGGLAGFRPLELDSTEATLDPNPAVESAGNTLETLEASSPFRKLGPSFLIDMSVVDNVTKFTRSGSFWELLPEAAASRPAKLADFIRSTVSTMPSLEPEMQRDLARWLTALFPILGPEQVTTMKAVVAHVRSAATAQQQHGKEEGDYGQSVESFTTLALLPFLSPDERYRELVGRPNKSQDDERMECWFGELSKEVVDDAFQVISQSTNRIKRRRALWLLGGAKPALTARRRGFIVGLADSSHMDLRAMALRFACLADDLQLGRQILALGRDYGDPTVLTASEWGRKEWLWALQLFAKYQKNSKVDELVKRLGSSGAAFVVEAHGCRRADVAAYASHLDREWRRVVEAPGELPIAQLPELQLAVTMDRAQANSPFRVAVALEGNSPIEEAPRGSSWSVSTSRAMRLFGHRFAPGALASIAERHDAIVKHWLTVALEDGPVGERAMAHLGSFYHQLCEALLQSGNDAGLVLWGALRDHEVLQRTDAVSLIFAAPRSEAIDVARMGMLATCTSDLEIAHVAVAAQQADDGWLDEVINQLVDTAALPKKALGLAVASYSHLLSQDFEALVKRADVSSTWVGAVADIMRQRNRRDLDARVWFERFLKDADIGRAWAAFEVAMHLADQRFLLWGVQALEAHQTTDDRLKLLDMRWDSINNSLERRGIRLGRFHGIDTTRVYPFHG